MSRSSSARNGRLSASLEPLCPCGTALLLRVHGPGGKLGEPYGWCVTVVLQGDGGVELKGLCRRPTPDEIAAGEESLRQAGFTYRVYTHKGRPVRKSL